MTAKTKQSGFTLIELLVGVTVGLLVIGSVSALFIPSLGTFRSNQGISYIQENERFAFNILAQSIDQAGFIGCNSSNPIQTINVTNLPGQAAPWTIQVAAPMQIVSADAPAARVDAILGGTNNQDINGHERPMDNTTPAQPIGDIITTISSGGNTTILLINHNVATQEITFRGNLVNSLDGEFVTMNDCNITSIFQIANGVHNNGETPGDSSDDTTTFSYASADTINCDALDSGNNPIGVLFGGDSTASCANNANRQKYAEYIFAPGTNGASLVSKSYYLAKSGINRNIPSLYSITAVSAPGNPTTVNLTTTELIAGVENFRARYGFVVSGTGNILYATAKDFDNDNDIDGDGTDETFRNVVSLEINLMLRSNQAKGERGAYDKQDISFLDVNGSSVSCASDPDSAVNNSACPKIMNSSPLERSRIRRVIRKRFNLRNITL